MQDDNDEGLMFLVLDGAAMDFMDATGLEVMQAVLLKPPRGLRVVLADPSRDLLDILKRGGVLRQLGEKLFSAQNGLNCSQQPALSLPEGGRLRHSLLPWPRHCSGGSSAGKGCSVCLVRSSQETCATPPYSRPDPRKCF